MKVHLIKRQTIEDYATENAGCRLSFRIWLNVLRFADWAVAQDILDTFGSADILGNGTDRVVFNIAGN